MTNETDGYEVHQNGMEVAVIGLAGRFPGASTIEAFWENLRLGKETISFFTIEQLEEFGISPEVYNQGNYVNAMGIVEGAECFDSAFFGFTPQEAELMDPQMRIFFEVVWTALEDAAIDPGTYEGSIALYAGGSANPLWELKPMIVEGNQSVFFAGTHLSTIDFLATRVAHKLNLRGPAITFQTACSTGLVAVDLGCKDLLTGQCDIAIAGGVTINTQRLRGYLYEEGMIRSPDGHCRAFDARAKGTIFSEGVGVAVLKRWDDAQADGNTIHAVIKSSAVNNDGIRKNSFSAPSIYGQADVIRTALHLAEVDAETIHFVEAHGSGTELGDPIEVEALKIAFNTDKRGFCAIGSLKSNVGHMDTGAGIGGFLKAVLAVKHGYIPPSLHFEKPNPKIDFANSPFYVNSELIKWEQRKYPRRAGVSSFGIGGTNAHVIIEETFPVDSSPVLTSSSSREYQILTFSGKTNKALERNCANFIEYFKKNSGVNLADVAYTLQVGRQAFKHRKALVATNITEAIEKLSAAPGSDVSLKSHYFVSREDNRIVLMFSGQGSQYVNMGLELYRHEPVFREEMEKCFKILRRLMEGDIKSILYPGEVHSPLSESGSLPGSEERINQTAVTQPVIFVIEYALAQWLLHWKIKPFAMIGHSIGEYVAACLAGVFSLEDALRLVVLRGKLMQKMSPGAMLSVRLPEEQLSRLLMTHKELALAAVNSPDLCVISGPPEAVDSFEKELERKEIQTRLLHTSHAFHSAMMDPVLRPFAEQVGRVRVNRPQIPYLSNLTGDWITIEEVSRPSYWSDHLRSTVRFAAGISTLLKEENVVFIEVGPGKALSTFISQHTLFRKENKTINLLRHPQEEEADDFYLYNRMAQLWTLGVNPDWKVWWGEERRLRLQLPTYSFESIAYPRFLDKEDFIGRSGDMGVSFSKQADISQWYYTPSWKRTIAFSGKEAVSLPGNNTLLMFLNSPEGLGRLLAQELHKDGYDIVVVFPGEGFKENPGSMVENHIFRQAYCIQPGNRHNYDTLFDTLVNAGSIPGRIIHLWNLSLENKSQDMVFNHLHDRSFLDVGFYSLLYLAQLIGQRGDGQEIPITVISDRMQDVTGDENLCPGKAVLLGPVMIIPQEYPHIQSRSVDIICPQAGSDKERHLVGYLKNECLAPVVERQIAWRGNHRLVLNYEANPLERMVDSKQVIRRLRPHGVYMITGGLGGIGLVLARYLAEKARASLILLGRSWLPPREEWGRWLTTHHENNRISHIIRKIRELEEFNVKVCVYQADVTNRDDMERIVVAAEAEVGLINGVIHAAGLPGGGLILSKTREMAERVLAPKVDGTLILEQVLGNHQLDFMVLCSSINSIVPIFGQVDYFAANAFMDVFAAWRMSIKGQYTVSINWDSWQELGMAVDSARKLKSPIPDESVDESQTVYINHPLIHRYIPVNSDRDIYLAIFKLEEIWPLNEHMLRETGQGILPGVAYLEMAQVAMQRMAGNAIVEFHDVYFLNPMIVRAGEALEVCLEMNRRREKFFEFSVKSRPLVGPENWQNHVAGAVQLLDPVNQPEPIIHNIEMIESNCNIREMIVDENLDSETLIQNRVLAFGPRWKALKKAKFGEKKGLAFLQLSEAYQVDFDQFYLHPAMFDISTAFLFASINANSPYVPFSYKRIRIHGRMGSPVFSYSRLVELEPGQTEYLKFNITIMDETGKEVMDVEEFTMLEVSLGIMERIQEKRESITDVALTNELVRETVNIEGTQEISNMMIEAIKNGILPAEGVEVFERILGTQVPQIVLSTYSLPFRLSQQLSAGPGSEIFKEEERVETSRTGSGYNRPEISSDYVAPRTETEKLITVVLQDVLGLKEVGILDDFFELGGDSLKGLSVTGRLQKKTQVAISMAELFKRPTAKALAEYFDTHRQEATRELEENMIQPVEEREYYPISSGQRRLYVLHMMEPNLIVHNLTTLYKWSGEVDPHMLENAVKRFIQRHDSMRTSFALIGNILVQRVHEKVDFNLQYIDYEKIQGKLLQEVIAGFVQPFDLNLPPFLRVALIHLGSNNFQLCIDIHHLIADGISLGVFFNEVVDLYNGRELPAVSFQYKDYCEWQRLSRDEPMLKKQHVFWMDMFAGELPVLDLPYDYERPAIQSHEGNSLLFNLGTKETEMLNAFTRETETTLFMTVLALIYLLLAKLSDQEDIVVGTPSSGRKQPEFQSVVGVFINTLAIRNLPTAGKTVREFISEVKKTTLSAFDNQDFHFEDLVDSLSLTRDLRRSALFDVMLIFRNELPVEMFRNQDQEGQESENTWEEELSYVKPAIEFDLIWEVMNAGSFLKIKIDYCTALFKKETIRRFAFYFNTMIKAVSANPDVYIKDLGVMTDDEKRQVLENFNRTDLDYPGEKTVVELFEEQVDRVPGELAVVDVGDNPGLSYGELHERAKTLTSLLVQRGVKSGAIVAVMVERSAGMFVALLAIMKSGGAYCPLDPGYPRARIAYILEKSGAALLLTSSGIREQWRDLAFDHEIIDISSNEVAMAGSLARLELKSSATSRDLAYVIFTSGSTGNPKGVMIEHGNVVNFIFSMRELIAFVPGKSILALTTISFDIFVLETLLPLCTGMTVVVADEAVQTDPVLLRQKIVESGIHMLQLTPSRVQLLLSSDPGLACLQGISELMVGGEALPFSLFKEIKKYYRGRFYNMYGPTETTVWSAVKDLTDSLTVTIGKPIGNTQVYIINRNGGFQPIGLAGELYISGDGVGRGYLDNEPLTSERFGENPLLKDKRWYRTGDLARWLPNGELEFLGRLDHQVKIRGFRIELAEIEEQLNAHPWVKEAVVISHTPGKTTPGDPAESAFLCAYLVPVSWDEEEAVALDQKQFRDYLSRTLPEYMIPAFFIALERFPLTPNSKIDRKALPEPLQKIKHTLDYTAPASILEEKLADLWSEILGIEKEHLGIDTNFFNIGGHSLRATILIARIHREFSVNIPMLQVFKAPTIRMMAEYIRRADIEQYIEVESVEEREYFPVSSLQKRLYIVNEMGGTGTAYNLFDVLAIDGQLNREILEKAFKALIHRHQSLRTSFMIINGQIVQRIHEEVVFNIKYYAGQSYDEGEMTGTTQDIIDEFVHPFNLALAPLLRVGIIEFSSNKNLLLFDIHHIVADGMSLRILGRDVMDFFQGKELEPLKIQYKDFSQWQNSPEHHLTLKNSEAYWLEQFEKDLPKLNIYTDYPRGKVQGFAGGSMAFTFDAEIKNRIHQLMNETETTLYMVLLAAFNVLLSKYSGQEDIVVGTPVSGRKHIELENIIGLFINALPMRNFPQFTLPFRDFLGNVKINTINAFDNQDYHFGELIDRLNIKTETSRNPLFDVELVVQNMEEVSFNTNPMLPSELEKASERVSNDGFRTETVGVERRFTQVDIALYVTETNEAISIFMTYSTELYKQETMERFRDTFRRVIETILENPGIPLGEIAREHQLGEASSDTFLGEDTGFDF